ncbi:MAG: hypothetical protein JXR19_06650 [Bacteroidia bacterium]
MKKFSAVVILLLVISSCDNKNEPPVTFSLPLPGAMYLGFTDSSVLDDRFGSYIDSFYLNTSYQFDNMSYYIDSNKNKVYGAPTFLFKEQSSDSFYYPYYVLAINKTAHGHFAKESLAGTTWYIDWPGGKQDTLFADYLEDPDGPNSCMCLYPLESLLLNGKSMIENTKLYDNGVYVFEP